MKKISIMLLLTSIIGCAPAYMVPQNSKTATINVSHKGEHPSSTTIDVFSSPKCEKQFYLGELADIGTNIDLKKSATGKIEANKIIYFSGTRHWRIRGTTTEAWCSLMFSFTPKDGAVYNMEMTGSDYNICSVKVSEDNEEKPIDLQMYKVNRLCLGDHIHYEK